MIQITIIKITGYGPWTLTLGSDREHRLQILQAQLYKEIQNLFSQKNCLAFPNRFDEIFVITNGLSIDDHTEIQKQLIKLFDLGLSMSIGQGNTPLEASVNADKARRSKTSLNKDYDIFGLPMKEDADLVQIIHMDVDGSTSVSAKKSPYEVSSLVIKLYSEMSEFFLQKNSLAFFMGGDNFMIINSQANKNDITQFLEIIKQKYDISFNCGIGTAKTGRDAARLATQSLDKIRQLRDSGKKDTRILELTC
ncbi:GTP cyclohydrolase III [Nitrosotalea sinensis]|jgi:GTP cyclohydrolase IIa|uniref:GTP cyclohydrolase III n=1 Tax=Nitrosotalea sinensis TaxID=1499975 RepID=A0A2H1EG05_9ARCH|nr:GTP cyclohydrolase IIa [Candidatus Nitrosotalea sinensis]SHO44016.1 GTP cyclohydrolase III [Candidatus Nitrosotalea sinensis]